MPLSVFVHFAIMRKKNEREKEEKDAEKAVAVVSAPEKGAGESVVPRRLLYLTPPSAE